MIHKMHRIQNGDYMYRSYRITTAELIATNDHLNCQYDWQPMRSFKTGKHKGWFISKEAYTFGSIPQAIESTTACEYEHENFNLNSAKEMIDNHIDVTDSKFQTLKENLGIANRLMTDEDLDILRVAQTKIRDEQEAQERLEKYNNLVSIVWDIIGSDKANGNWTFEQTAQEVINTLKHKKHISI
tara:strand:+ start:60 stop:614 length:555 start_codon:yes stop_codon:yes gene_type:complete